VISHLPERGLSSQGTDCRFQLRLGHGEGLACSQSWASRMTAARRPSPTFR